MYILYNISSIVSRKLCRFYKFFVTVFHLNFLNLIYCNEVEFIFIFRFKVSLREQFIWKKFWKL